jgi:dolichol-phosphate mannosyltransferase
MEKKLISIVTPVFNEEESIDYYFEKIFQEIKKLSHSYDFEIILTDNSSTDKTFKKIKEQAKSNKNIRAYKLSKNFGYQKSLWTGICQSRGDAVIPIDCDLQDSPELIKDFINVWNTGEYKIVCGKRTSRKESFRKTKKIVDLPMMRNFFYFILNKISEDKIPRDVGDFMLLDKIIVEKIRTIKDQNIYLRGVIFSLGFKQKILEYERGERKYGTTKFYFGKSLKLAIDGIVGLSSLPLRIASIFGIVIATLTLLLSIFFILSKFMFNINYPAGLTTIIVLVLFGISLNALFLGIIGEYLSRIYDQQKNRPITIIEEKVND